MRIPLCFPLLFLLLFLSQSRGESFLIGESFSRNSIGATYRITEIPISTDLGCDIDSLRFRLALNTGNLIILEQSGVPLNDPENVSRFLSDSLGYKRISCKKSENGRRVYILKAFTLPAPELLAFLDGPNAKFISDMTDDISTSIKSNESLFESRIGINLAIDKKIGDKDSLLKFLEKDKSALETMNAENNKLEQIIEQMDSDIKRISKGANSISMNYSSNSAMFEILGEYEKYYRFDRDFFRSGIHGLIQKGMLTSIAEKPWFNKNTNKNPYLHPELAEIIRKINSEKASELRRMGFKNGLVVASGYRTPLAQSMMKSDYEVVAAMWSSGHGLGVAVDFDDKDVITRNYDPLVKMIEPYGLYAPPSLKKTDPVHFFLAKFRGKTDDNFVINLMNNFYETYLNVIEAEKRFRQDQRSNIVEEIARLNKYAGNLDDASRELKKNIEEIAKAKILADNRSIELKRKKEEKGLQLSNVIRKMGKKNPEFRKEMRTLLGYEKERFSDYWKSMEVEHLMGSGFECFRETYLSNEGHRWEVKGCVTFSPSKSAGVRQSRNGNPIRSRP